MSTTASVQTVLLCRESRREFLTAVPWKSSQQTPQQRLMASPGHQRGRSEPTHNVSSWPKDSSNSVLEPRDLSSLIPAPQGSAPELRTSTRPAHGVIKTFLSSTPEPSHHEGMNDSQSLTTNQMTPSPVILNVAPVEEISTPHSQSASIDSPWEPLGVGSFVSETHPEDTVSPRSPRGLHIAPPGPQQHPGTDYLFTSRSQRYGASRGITFEWTQLAERRLSKNNLKHQLQNMKTALRPKAFGKTIAEDRLFQSLRKRELGLSTSPTREEPSISDLLKEYERARNEFDPAEDDCRLLQDQLDIEEFEIERLERSFFERWKEVLESVSVANQPPILSPVQSSEVEEFEEEDEEDDIDVSYDPRVVEYLSKLGDLDIARERLDEVFEEQDNLEEQKENRSKFGIALGVEEQTWLDNSPNLVLEAEEEVQKLEEEVETLRQECFSLGLIGEDGEPIDMAEREHSMFSNEPDVDAGSQVSEYARYPILLKKPLLDNAVLPADAPESEDRKYTLGGIVSKWMLERLRTSALEVNLLARTYETEAKGKESSEKWQISVLKLWYRDGTIGIEANTASAQSPASYFSDNLIRYSNQIAKTASESLVRIRIWEALPSEADGDTQQNHSGGVLKPLQPLNLTHPSSRSL